MSSPDHDLVKGIDSGPIAKIMLAELARLLVGIGFFLGSFCLGFWMGRM